MTKLTNAEKDKLDNTCGNLRVTKLGTHVKSLEDFVNEMQLDTQANTVAEAINELYHMFVDKDCSSIQIPPPGFFTLWGNDEDGKLYCYYNDKDHPPLFKHIEDENDDLNGTLYLYIADPYGDNHYEMEIGQYIAVKHLENYYTKAEIDAGYAIKNHAVNAATYGKGTASVFGHLKVANNLTTTSTDAIALAAAQGKVLKELVDGKADADHPHVKADITDFPTKVSAFTNDKGYLTSHQSLTDYAKTAYVDQQIANIEGDIEVDFASKADVNHTHGNLSKDGKVGTVANKPLITGTNGVVQAGSFGTAANTFCQGNDSRLSDARTPTSHTHMLDDINITSALGANSDLNDLTNVGIYTCGSANSGTLANRPPFSGNFDMLIENKHYNDTAIVQFVYVLMRASPLSFYRYLNSNGVWSSWTHNGGCSYTLPANSDLNDLKEFTTYACNTTNSETLANKPFTDRIPCIIKNMPYNNVNYFIQFLYPLIDNNNLNSIYYRLYWKGTWLDWKKIITNDDIDDLNDEIDTKLTNKANKSHAHFLDDINVTSALTANDDLNNYNEVGIYTCSKTNSGKLANKPYNNNFACIIENKKYGSGSIVQFVYKVTTQATTCYDSYFRCYTGSTWTDWVRIYTDKDFVVSDSLTDTSTKNALSANQGKVLNDAVKTAYDKANSIVSGNSSSATVIPSLPTGWSGTIRYYCRNGFMIVAYEALQKTSTGTSLETLFSLPVNNDLGYPVYDNSSTAVPNDGVIVQVSANGAFRARCLQANTPKYGHIIFPYS